MKKAIITGINGQDGTYMANLLIEKGYKIYGVTRFKHKTKFKESKNLILIEWKDFLSNLEYYLKSLDVDYFFNFSAYSSINNISKTDSEVMSLNGYFVEKCLKIIYSNNLNIKYSQASSSEMYGIPADVPQNENTFFNPTTIYGKSKLYAHEAINHYRDYKELSCSSMILYNHESPLRNEKFVTRKITLTAVKIKLGLERELVLGNIDSKRDWMHASDTCNAIYHLTNLKISDNYIIASGVLNSVETFCKTSFERLNLDFNKYLKISTEFKRDQDSFNLIGDPKKLYSTGWTPKYSFQDLVNDMVDNDYNNVMKKMVFKSV